MKWIKTYENYSDRNVFLKEEINSIFIDLIQGGSSIDVSFPGRKSISQEPADILRIVFNDRSRSSFNPLKYIDSFYHLDSFLQSKGWRYFSDGSWYDTHEKLMKSFEKGGDLLLLQINYIKDKE